MANLNYVGSLAQRKMRFSSTTDVVVNNTDELFHALTIYIPKRFAQQNIIGWNNGIASTGERLVTADRPAVYVAVVENYTSIMTGDLLTQWQPVFRQDTNADVILYLVIFDDEQGESWTLSDTNIEYAPLTKAFNALFSFSYFKFMFDPHNDGRDVILPKTDGSKANMTLRLFNSSAGGEYATQDVVFTNNSLPVTGHTGTIVANVTNTGSDTPAVRGTFSITVTNNSTTDAAEIPLGIPTCYTDGATSGTTNTSVYSISGGGGMGGTTIAAGASVTLSASQTNPGLDPNFPVVGNTVTIIIGGTDVFADDTDVTAVVSATPAPVPGVDSIPFVIEVPKIITIKQEQNATLTYMYSNYAGPTTTIGAGESVSRTFDSGINSADDYWKDSGPLFISSTMMPTADPALTITMVSGTEGAPDTAGSTLTLPAGNYSYDDGAKVWSIAVPQEFVLPPGETTTMLGCRPATVGFDPNLLEGQDITDLFYGTLPPVGFVVTSTNIFAGENPGGQTITITPSTYIYNDGGKSFPIVVSAPLTMNVNDVSAEILVEASTVGVDANLGTGLMSDGSLDPARITPALPVGIRAMSYRSNQGVNATTADTTASSQYFDLSLALAVLCRNNIELSWFWSMVGISYDGQMANPLDKCHIRYATRENQLANMTSISNGDRSRYYWAALYLLQCQNTTVILHSRESTPTPTATVPLPTVPSVQYIIADILSAWFGQKNESGLFIGNKLSLLRLSGTRIKPLGWSSWLDSSVRENDSGVHQTALGPVSAVEMLDDMNVGYLYTIASNTPQESILSMARGVGDPDKGIPVTMMMIAKYVDYSCSQEAAKMVTDTGTLTNPVLTDEVAYASIQLLVARALGRFAGTNGRIYGVTMIFPDFSVARTSRTAITASSAWKAWYKDDLDTVQVSGGIVAS